MPLRGQDLTIGNWIKGRDRSGQYERDSRIILWQAQERRINEPEFSMHLGAIRKNGGAIKAGKG